MGFVSSGFRSKLSSSLVIALIVLSAITAFLFIAPAYGAWWNGDWAYRKKITIDYTKVAGTLADFPVLVDVSDSDLASKAQTDGDDIVFTDNAGNKLDHEIELYDNSTGRLIAWVEVPSLSSTVNTILYVYYGNPAATNQQNAAGTWNANYIMVQHLKEASGTAYDSTGYQNSGTPYGGVSQNITGKVDGAASFDGVNDYIDCGNKTTLNNLNDEITVEAWIYVSSIAGNNIQLAYKVGPAPTVSNGFQFVIFGSGAGTLAFRAWVGSTLYGGTGGGKVTVGGWQHVVGTFTTVDDKLRSYINGTVVSTQSGPNAVPSTGYNLTLAGWPAYPVYGYVKLDEVRISNVTRSDAWISTEYNNQQSPSSFFSLGVEETPAGTVQPEISNPSPANGVTDVSISLSKLSFDLYDSQNDSMDYYITTNPNIGSDSQTGVYNGAYEIAVSGLQRNTTYVWHVNATDPLGSGKWTNETFSFKTIEQLNIVSSSPETLITRDRGTQQTFQVSYNTPADTIWYLDSIQQQLHNSLQVTSWIHKFNSLGIFNVTAVGTDGLNTVKAEWSVQVIINFSGGVVERRLTNFGPSQAWEEGFTIDESIIKDGDMYQMLYAGGPIGSREIGYAWSYDGLNWTKYEGNPVLSPVPGTWESREVFFASSILKINGTYWVYYQGISTLGGTGSGLARGTSLTNLTRYEGNPIVSDDYELTVAKYNETLWIGYNSYSSLHCLTSPDGLNWTYLQRNIKPPTSGWDNNIHHEIDLLASTSWPPTFGFMGGTMYTTVTGNDQDGGVDYCRVGDWTHLTSSPYNPILPHGTGIETHTVGFHMIYNEELDCLDCWYLADQTLSGSGLCGEGFGRIYGVTGKNTAPSISEPSPTNGATGVAISTSTLGFTILDRENDNTNYTVSTFPNIGSGSGTNVTNGRYDIPISGLTYSTVYNWTIAVHDGILWTNQTFTFTTEPNPTFDPFSEGWNYRKKITIDHSKVSGDQTNFPILIDITDLDLALKAQPDGDDIVFMNNIGEALRLKHEIEYYNSSSGHLIAWVKIPNLSSSIDTVFYMCYGNSTCSNQQDPTNVWDSNFMMVQHLKETSETTYDSTIFQNYGSPTGVTQGVSGKIDGAVNFSGVSSYIECANSTSLNPTIITLEAWIKPNTVSGTRPIIEKYDYVTGKGSYLLRQQDSNIGVGTPAGITSHTVYANGVLQVGNWYYVVGTYDGNTLKVYVNGSLMAQMSYTGSVWASDQTLKIGARGDDKSLFFNGIIDEPAISNMARSDGWIATRYNNQYSTSTFYTISTEEKSGPPEILVSPATTSAVLGSDYTIYVNITSVSDLYGWEFQLNYDPAILDLTSTAIVSGGLNEPTQTFYSLTDEIAGHLWWAVSTTYPATTGISYSEHAIFQITFHTIGVGTSNVELYGTYLSYSNSSEIIHSSVNGSINVNAPDLTVMSVTVLDLGCSIYKNDTDASGNPYYYPIEVKITNIGNSDATTFYVKLEVYWITGSITEANEEISIVSLTQGTTATVNFTGLFHPMQTGFYRLIATVDCRSSVEESNESNNVLNKENVKVTVIGDLTGDGVVDILDGVRISLAWDSMPSDGWWNIKADINHNGLVNILDATRASLHWGETI